MELPIGVVVEVPEPFGSQLQAARARFGDELAEFVPTHVTLVPPTEVDPSPDHLAAIDEHLAVLARRHAPFTVHLQGTATFRPVSPVVYLPLASGAAQCTALQADCRTGVLAVPLKFPYEPHVTIAHRIDDAGLDRAYAEMAGFDARFSVTEITRYEYDDDGYWRPRARFGLAGG